MKYLIVVCLLLCGCASAGPIDVIVPTMVPYGLEEYLGHEVPSVKGVTTLAVLKGAKQEIEWRHSIDETMYCVASESTRMVIEATNEVRDGLLVGLAALGLGGAPVAFLAGKKKKRPEDFTAEEYEAAGKMNPEEFRS